jgi:hypothetical protein
MRWKQIREGISNAARCSSLGFQIVRPGLLKRLFAPSVACLFPVIPGTWKTTVPVFESIAVPMCSFRPGKMILITSTVTRINELQEKKRLLSRRAQRNAGQRFLTTARVPCVSK